jgi:transcriptional regulator GlxA family with amidase domain
LEEVAGRRAHELTDLLAGAPGPAGRVQVLDNVLAESVAGEAGLGHRHLGQLIRAELGLTPKTVARILRFGQARRCLRSGPTASLAQTAVKCGYSGRVRLTSDWKQLGGCTPGERMPGELRFVQDQGSGRSAR